MFVCFIPVLSITYMKICYAPFRSVILRICYQKELMNTIMSLRAVIIRGSDMFIFLSLLYFLGCAIHGSLNC